MFDLLARPLIYITVAWPGLIDDDQGNAREVEHSVDLQIELLDRAEFIEWLQREPPEEGPGNREGAIEFELERLRGVVKGWRDVKAGGRAAEFNADNLRRLLLVPGFPEAFTAAYGSAMVGKVKTREGNSAGSLANGPADEPTAATQTA